VLSSANLTTLNYSTANFLANFTLTRTRSASISGGANITDTTNYLANGPATPSIYMTPVGFKVDFGLNGLGNQPTSGVFDGVYVLSNKTGATAVPANAPYAFHRLLGDANGDNVVDALDTNLVQTVLTTPPWRYQNSSNLIFDNTTPSNTSVNPVAAYNWVGDLNCDGKINALDLNIVTFQRGRRVNYTRNVT
ncbi:MAG: dockerin type I domain-containing protein, partial [bacterium]